MNVMEVSVQHRLYWQRQRHSKKVWKAMKENQRSYYYQDQEVTTQKIIMKSIRKLDSTQMMIYLWKELYNCIT